jgi:hypothetical protein
MMKCIIAMLLSLSYSKLWNILKHNPEGSEIPPGIITVMY